MKPPAKRVINPTFTVVFIFFSGERSALLLVRSRWVPKPFKKIWLLCCFVWVVARPIIAGWRIEKRTKRGADRNSSRICKQGKKFLQNNFLTWGSETFWGKNLIGDR